MRRMAWIVGGIGLLASAVGWFVDPRAFAYAWLAAVSTWIGWPLGCLALLFVHQLTGGRWGVLLRPALGSGIATLPLLVPALVPVALLSGRLYPWLHANAAELPNSFYLNLPFAALRWLFFVVIWLGLGALGLSGSRRGGPASGIAVAGLILLALTVTFSMIDLQLSLEPQFNSSAFGMLAGAQDALLALTIAGGMTAAIVPARTSGFADLGRLLLALLVLWAYLDFMQLLIVWQSDLPHEAAWYRRRIEGPWGILSAILALGHFVLPFAALMSPMLRRSRRGIVAVATLLVCMAVLRGWWLVLPAGDRAPGWIDVAAMLGLGGVAAALTLPVREAMIQEPRHV